jgi:hypothetical protein
MSMYKLTKGSVSIIRQDEAGVKEAEANGYKLDGECNEAYEIINPKPFEIPKRGKPSKDESKE